MKKMNLILTLILTAAVLSACGTKSQAAAENPDSAVTAETVGNDSESEEETVIPRSPDADPNADVDLTTLTSNMVYAQVADMMYTPEKYTGKVIKAKGLFSVYHDEAQDKNYYAVLIQDATACCAQGIEFIWKGDHAYPDEYPEIGKEITVIGTFNTYEEDGATYTQLLDADLTVNS